MKKIVILFVFTLISLSTLRGQQKVEPTAVVAAEFNKQFAEASNIRWEKASEFSLARFRFQENNLLAYFDKSGNLVATGRKINEGQLPIKMHADLLTIKSNREQKVGTLVISTIYEYTKDSDNSHYVASLENDKVMILVSSENGKMTELKSTKRSFIPQAPQHLIAKVPQ